MPCIDGISNQVPYDLSDRLYPIKTKNAEEIALQLLDYIAMFGSSTQILSDQGTEFINQVAACLLASAGIEQLRTSAYNPPANELTGRFNKTLVSMLKRLSDDTPNEWVSWLPFAMLAYRSQKNATTKVRTLELLFARKMSKLQDLDFNETNLDMRIIEIHDRLISAARFKENSKTIATSLIRRNYVVEALPNGTCVYVRVPKKSKFMRFYNNPYIIYGQTDFGTVF